MVSPADKYKLSERFWINSFKKFYIYSKRNRLLTSLNIILNDIRDCNNKDELCNRYLNINFMSIYNISKGISKREKTLIEDSAFFIRELEIKNNNKFACLLGKEDLVEINELCNDIKKATYTESNRVNMKTSMHRLPNALGLINALI